MAIRIMQAFHEFKLIWDPEWKMNPGKVIETYGQLSDLRIDNNYNPPKLKTHFAFTDDDNDFSKATLPVLVLENAAAMKKVQCARVIW